MTVWCRQTAEGEPDQQYAIAPHRDDQTDAELLLAKANGASAKGWAVEWTSPTSFRATKDRWSGTTCTRDFWTD